MSGVGFLSLRCWLDGDGKHIWQSHDCNGVESKSILPNWQVDTQGNVVPSIHCKSCGLHAMGHIDVTPLLAARYGMAQE